MKKTYEFLMKLLYKFLGKLELKKILLVEKLALFKKRKMYRNIKWSKKQTKEFNNYWINNYGKKISTKGHKLYESINGIHNKEYIPDYIFATKIEPFFNSKSNSEVFSNKALTEI